jgi:DNA polymerase-1
MGLMWDGDGSTGLAALGLKATERECYSHDPLAGVRPLRAGIPSADWDGTFRACLFNHTEAVDKSLVKKRAAEFMSMCAERGIKCIMPIGTLPLRSISKVHGKSTTLIGSTIPYEHGYIVPLETSFTGPRALRSHMWNRELARFVRRAAVLARGDGRHFLWQPQILGEGPDVVEALNRILQSKSPVGVDLETTGGDHTDTVFTAFGLANAEVGVSTPWSPYGSSLYGSQPGLRNKRVRELIHEILLDPNITKLFHNGQFDLTMLRAANIEIAGEFHDTLLAHRIAFSDLFHNLQFCAGHEFALAPWKTIFNNERKARGEPDNDWAAISPRHLLAYNARDASIEPRLWPRHRLHLDNTHRGWEQYDRLRRLAGLAASMQFKGLRVDRKAVEDTTKAVKARIADVELRWNAATGGLLPMSGKGSKAALDHYFFRSLGAPVLSRSAKTSVRSLPSATLLEYDTVGDDKLADAAFTLYEYRKIKKAYDAFLKPLVKERLYARPNPAGTKGTRFSYNDPNLQQWSKEKTIVRTRYGKQEVELAPNLRHLITPDEGMVMGEHDYNALEARLVAYAAAIPDWLDWLARGVDMHIEHVFLMFGVRVTKSNDPDSLRDITKTLTYARFYNNKGSVTQVLRALKPKMPTLTETKLLKIMAAFDKARPEIVQWQQSVAAAVHKKGYVEVEMFGQRQIHDRRRPDMNQALSVGIQSCGGNIMNDAMLRIAPQLDAERGERILLQVHDALVWQAPPDRLSHVYNLVKKEMEAPIAKLWSFENVIIPTDGKCGMNWRDLMKLDKFLKANPKCV